MTDHRIDLTLYSLDRIVDGEIQPLLDALRSNELDERIKLALEDK
jgi:peptide chain release factor 1